MSLPHHPTPRSLQRPVRPVHARLGAPLALPLLLLSSALLLPGCNKPDPASPAQVSFNALTSACTQFLATRRPHVRPSGPGEWTQTGYSPAQVQAEVTRTESTTTPYVGKLVIKDNEAQASAPAEAAAAAITLTPAHLLSNRTHTFIYSFDGQQWRWQNGQRLIKMPGHNDRMEAVTLAEVAALGPKGFAGCLPQNPSANAIK